MTVPAVIPRPLRMESHPGQWQLSPLTRIAATAGLRREAEHLAAFLRRSTGFPMEITDAVTAQDNSIIRLAIDIDLSRLGSEGYRLIVGDTVELVAATPAGIFYGVQTLLQLFPPAIFGDGPRHGVTWSLPRLEIEDFPRFPWRGAMLDCGRHFFPVAFVRKFIDWLALHKLNTFHWHLTEDQGWRIEIKKYPKLTEIGAWRGGTWLGHEDAPSHDDGIPYGGFYTQAEIREIVRYAAERHITIVPEIEMPGHAQAALAAYPEYGCSAEKIEVRRRWGISENIFSPREPAIRFLQDVLTEVMDLFPGTFIHIGGDEAVKKEWDESHDIRAFMKEVGAADSHQLQSYFIRRMDRFLADHGRRLIGWDEILEGGLAEGAAVMSWRGTEGGVAAARQGHDVVMAPHAFTYLDLYQSQAIADEPLAIGHFLPLEKAYGYEPVPAELPPEQVRHILGLQAQVWTAYMPTAEIVEYMVFPRLAAVAEVGWSPRQERDYQDFKHRLAGLSARYNVMGIRYRPAM